MVCGTDVWWQLVCTLHYSSLFVQPPPTSALPHRKAGYDARRAVVVRFSLCSVCLDPCLWFMLWRARLALVLRLDSRGDWKAYLVL